MRQALIWALLAIGALLSGNVSSSADDILRFRFQLFVMTGSLVERSYLDEVDENIWNGSEEAWKKIRRDIELFDEGEYRFGSDRLEIEEDGCYWNDRKIPYEEELAIPLPDRYIRRIFSPVVNLKENELSTIKISTQQTFEYLERRPDGLFEVRTVDLPTGVDLTVRAKERDDKAVLDVMNIVIHAVTEREAVEGTSLEVGKPVLKNSEYRLSLKVKFNRTYGILVHLENNQGYLMICFDVDED